MIRLRDARSSLARFKGDQDGGLTVVNVIFLSLIAMLAGIAIDVSSVVAARTQLQATADAAAHAALVEREFHTQQEAKDKALAVAVGNMPAGQYGNVLSQQNITFGDYDRSTGTFTADVNSREAVLVQTERLSSQGNGVTTFLLQFVGLWDWDLRTTSLFETYFPTCLIEGFVAEEVIDIQSNNSYFNGFCIHSNSYVSINNNNFFEPGTVVSMPDTTDMVINITGKGEDKNEGLDEALREGKYFIKILNRIDLIIDGVKDRHSRYARDWINNYNVIDVDEDRADLLTGQTYKIAPSDLTKGRIYEVSGCSKVDFLAGTFEDIVFIADCPLEFSNGAVFEDATIITTSTADKSMRAPNNLVLGAPDSCADGGGAQLVTKGGIEVASVLEMHGSQIIAAKNVEFQSNTDGLNGASIVSGGRIDSTSNMNFAFCGNGMEHSFMAEYFRLVR